MPTPVLPPHDRLALAAISDDPAVRREARALLDEDGFDWPSAFRVAESNRVALFVARLLEEAPFEGAVPDDVREKWADRKTKLEARGERAIEQVRQVGDLLAAVSVRPLLYKGPDFQVRCYRDSGPRTFGDVDIIVRRDEIDATVRAITAAGYFQPPGAPSLDYYRRFHLHAIYLHPNHPNGLPLELHWALDSPYSHLPDIVPLLHQTAETCEEFGPNVLRPSALDALALMVVHLDKHLGLAAALPGREQRLKSVIEAHGLVWVLDVVKWMRHFSDAYAGDVVLPRMQALAAERALVIALRLVHDLDAEVLPDWARELAERLPHGRPMITRIIFPDLSAGDGTTAAGKKRRSFLFGDLPGLGFRPVRLVELFVPSFRVPGVTEPAVRKTLGGTLKRVALGGANLLAIASWKIRGEKGEDLEPASRD